MKVWQLMQGQNGSQAMRSNQPIVTKDIADITEATVSNIYTGPCRPPYLCDYVWQVQAVARDGKPLGNNEGKSEPYHFGIQDAGSAKPPDLVSPTNNNTFNESDAKQPITFRWTSVEPKPQEPVTYRMKVWQLMQGQNGSQAMRTNQPIVTKDVDNITQALVQGIYTGPCKPPYLCDYVWQVQALSRDGKPLGNNEGKSGEFTFGIHEAGSVKPPVLFSPVNNNTFNETDAKQSISFSWTPVTPKPQEPVTYRMKVWQLMQGQNGSQAMRSNQPIVTKDVADITQATVSNIYTGPCKPPYLCDFVWQVQAMGRDGKPMGENEGKSEAFNFSVKAMTAVTGIKPPALISPVNNKNFNEQDAKQPITFRWTPVDPKPQEPVTYRMKVWQLMQGQNGSQAMRTNQPIVTKDVADITEVNVGNIYTGPCKPPYLCSFVWNVQALDRQGKPIGDHEGTSEAWNFKIQNNIDIQIDSLKVGCCIDGKQAIYLKIKNNLASSVNIVAVKYKINGAGAAINLTPIAPSLVQLVAGNGTVIFTSNIDCIDNLVYLKFLVDAEDVSDPDNKETEVKSDTPQCACNDCDEKHFILKAASPDNITIANNNINFNQPLTITTNPPKTVKNIKAELVYFEMVPENDLCIPCNKDAATYGHFTNGTNSLQWGKDEKKFEMNINTPQLTPCCSALFKWCIRYKIEFTDCSTCNKLICYEKKKEGCEKAPANGLPK
jgi:hypothetical protein